MNDDYTDRRFIARRHPMTRGQDLAAAVKVLRCLAAGFQRLEYHGLDWEPVEVVGIGEDPLDVVGIGEDPYYVCARFASGRHVPGPILAHRAHQRGLQGLVVRVALALRVPAAMQARTAWQAYADKYHAVWAARDAAAAVEYAPFKSALDAAEAAGLDHQSALEVAWVAAATVRYEIAKAQGSYHGRCPVCKRMGDG